MTIVVSLANQKTHNVFCDTFPMGIIEGCSSCYFSKFYSATLFPIVNSWVFKSLILQTKAPIVTFGF